MKYQDFQPKVSSFGRREEGGRFNNWRGKQGAEKESPALFLERKKGERGNASLAIKGASVRFLVFRVHLHLDEERQEGPLLVFPFGQEGVLGTRCSRSADEDPGDGCLRGYWRERWWLLEKRSALSLEETQEEAGA